MMDVRMAAFLSKAREMLASYSGPFYCECPGVRLPDGGRCQVCNALIQGRGADGRWPLIPTSDENAREQP